MSLEFETWDLRLGSWGLEFETWNLHSKCSILTNLQFNFITYTAFYIFVP